MLRVGLYGGIGSGKSTVAEIFTQLGVSVIDADLIARELSSPNSALLKEIKSTLGSKIVKQGNLNRALLRKIICSDETARKQLNTIMHPPIRQELKKRIAQSSGLYCIIVVPLLLESGMVDLVDRVVVVDCPEQSQLDRVTKRDKISADEAMQMIAAQANRHQRLEIADSVLDNGKNILHLKKQVLDLHKNLIEDLTPNGGKQSNRSL